ncbi:hypothetical protein DSO57_1039011 [Entomophthora muscae]|uniref:Uncharacterized protein n=1 Tax=Entomophthora muscae TaxID=34485 RepID=A0ACC2TKM0_9FUNG|nr:hypothetical protein DSO57_1039011 [Entomophthora muscae]
MPRKCCLISTRVFSCLKPSCNPPYRIGSIQDKLKIPAATIKSFLFERSLSNVSQARQNLEAIKSEEQLLLFSRVPDSLAKPCNKWTPALDKKLLELGQQKGSVTWKMLATKHFPEFSHLQIYDRYQDISRPWGKGKWSTEELYLLKQAVPIFGSDWVAISERVGTRCRRQCRSKWRILIDPEIGRTPWTAEESERLVRLVIKDAGFQRKNKCPDYSNIDWKAISKYFPSKTIFLCQRHFFNKLCDKAQDKLNLPPFDKGSWPSQQSTKLIALVEQHSNNWTLISSELQTRSPRQCSSHWNRLKIKKHMVASNAPLNRRRFTPLEDDLLLRMYRLLGKQWKVICSSQPAFSSRTPSAILGRFLKLMAKLQKPWFTLLPELGPEGSRGKMVDSNRNLI